MSVGLPPHRQRPARTIAWLGSARPKHSMLLRYTSDTPPPAQAMVRMSLAAEREPTPRNQSHHRRDVMPLHPTHLRFAARRLADETPVPQALVRSGPKRSWSGDRRARVRYTSRIHLAMVARLGDRPSPKNGAPKALGAARLGAINAAHQCLPQFWGEHGRHRLLLAIPGGSLFQ